MARTSKIISYRIKVSLFAVLNKGLPTWGIDLETKPAGSKPRHCRDTVHRRSTDVHHTRVFKVIPVNLDTPTQDDTCRFYR